MTCLSIQIFKLAKTRRISEEGSEEITKRKTGQDKTVVKWRTEDTLLKKESTLTQADTAAKVVGFPDRVKNIQKLYLKSPSVITILTKWTD